MTTRPSRWTCPICGGHGQSPRFRAPTTATEGGVDAARFIPASAGFGTTAGQVVRCRTCGHGSLLDAPDEDRVASAYEDAADEETLREEAGQVATATRDLATIAAVVGGPPGRLLDIGCWTGSFVAAAADLGWDAEGIEPSAWACERARARGLSVRRAALGPGDGLPAGAYRAVVACDVLEHLHDPGAAIARARDLLEPDGALFVTVPDAGSPLARILGRRWWSVLPMHLQYFTRSTATRLLERHGFRIRHLGTHAKVFSRRYYADRVGEFVPVVGPRTAAWVAGTAGAGRLVAPDLRDRMAIVAQRA